jgi:hypothetical protein
MAFNYFGRLEKTVDKSNPSHKVAIAAILTTIGGILLILTQIHSV